MKKLFSLACMKASVLFGGRPLLMPLSLLILALCLFAVRAAVTASAASEVNVCVVDECGGEYSKKLTESLSSAPGIKALFPASVAEAEDEISAGNAEALIVIPADYDDRVAGDNASGLIRVVTAPGSVSADMIRETVSGKMILLRAELRAKAALVSEGYDISRFDEYEMEFRSPTLYRVVEVGGSSADRAVFGKGFPGYEGFAALALMLLVLTLTKQFGARESRLVAGRLCSVRHGGSLAFSSDIAAVFGLCLIYSVPAFAIAPERSLPLALGLVSYSLCLTGLCLLLAKVGGSGRIDMASPFIALVTSILGGCFAELGSLSPALGLIAKFTPQGQLIAAASGKLVFCALLAAEGALLALVSRLVRRNA
ncbi:MAG: ABC transporter permease [Clostridiales bacterium]|nr:ABC transporter permease [Clostridiales bacterium]